MWPKGWTLPLSASPLPSPEAEHQWPFGVPWFPPWGRQLGTFLCQRLLGNLPCTDSTGCRLQPCQADRVLALFISSSIGLTYFQIIEKNTFKKKKSDTSQKTSSCKQQLLMLRFTHFSITSFSFRLGSEVHAKENWQQQQPSGSSILRCKK